MKILDDLKFAFYNRISKWLSDTGIIDNAYNRNTVESDITGYGRDLGDLLIPLLKWRMPYDHHWDMQNEAEALCRRIKSSSFSNEQWPTEEEYYRWTFKDAWHDQITVCEWIECTEYLHRNQPPIRTNREVYVQFEQIFRRLAKDWADKTYNRITDYLPADSDVDNRPRDDE